VNNWSWDFGVAGEAGDTSHLQHASYQYATQGDKMVRLIVKSSKGCNGVIEKPASVTDKPYLNLPFRDTLICSIDSLLLIAQGNGIFNWTPNHNIVNAGSANPVVFPKDTMVYVVELNESGCRNKDSIRVNVLDYITVTANADTAICRTDSINLSVTSHALSFQWEPSEGLNDATTKNPGAAPFTTTTYQVTANLGKCQAKDSVTVRVSPYPQVQAGADTSICFGDRVQLNATANCLDHSWFPSLNMLNPTSLQPQAAPSKTTVYIISAAGYDECPKAVHDTVVVTVIPPVKAFAGNDTIITGDEPLVLQASGGLHYSWSPASYLNDPGIANPLVLLSNNIDSMRYQLSVTTAEGCKGEDDISIVVFKTGPQIFVPDAFTPNKDLRNDLLYPVVVGMKHLDFFRVYNRYGQLIFSTSEIGKGWDGTFAGREQAPGTYVFMAQAVNYKGETVFKKGTVLLLR
jgi:gliding motility-associated-like protein